MDVSKITRQSCSREFMKKYLQEALEQKTITKKAFNEWKIIVRGIEAEEGTAPEKLKKVKAEFYDRFIKPEKEKLKKKVVAEKKKSSHPLYDMFNDIVIEEKKD